MGNWYSTPLIDSIYNSVKENYDIEIPEAICEEIVYFSITIESSTANGLKFIVEGDKPTHSDYHLDFSVQESDGSGGMGALLVYPEFNSGCWKFEMLVIKQGYGMAIGVVDTKEMETFSLEEDFEYNAGCYGYYNGGVTLNLCANAERVHYSIDDQDADLQGYKWDNVKVGVYVDFDKHKLSAIHNDKVLTNFEIDIPSNTSYCFYFSLFTKTDKLSVYPPIQL